MKTMKVLVVAMLAVVMTGCVTTDEETGKKKVSYTYNMQQATWRSGGDLAMTALLDTGIDKAEAVEFANAVVAFLESGEIVKSVFRAKVLEVAPVGYADYVDALFSVVPSEVSFNEKIPENVRTGLVSFLKDGAGRAAELYREDKRND